MARVKKIDPARVTVSVVEIRVPSAGVLAKYGLTEADWVAMWKRQGGVCAVCLKLPPNKRLCTDHDHVKGWKKMRPEERKKYVRGLLCYFCNHWYVGRCITVEKAENVAEYLRAHAARLGNAPIRGIR